MVSDFVTLDGSLSLQMETTGKSPAQLMSCSKQEQTEMDIVETKISCNKFNSPSRCSKPNIQVEKASSSSISTQSQKDAT